MIDNYTSSTTHEGKEMGTISKGIAEVIIQNDGYYHGDCIVKVITYNNQFDGGLEYACVHAHENYYRYENAPACHNVTVIWEKK